MNDFQRILENERRRVIGDVFVRRMFEAHYQHERLHRLSDRAILVLAVVTLAMILWAALA